MTSPLARPPQSLRPDRWESVSLPGEHPPAQLAPGVMLDVLVGACNHARGLTTALVTLAPGGRLDYHTHPVGEAITVLSGTLTMGVEGREYTLGPLDNVAVPQGLAHSTWNAGDVPVVMHAALASENPRRDFVAAPTERRAMPVESTGVSGRERCTRFATAARHAAGPGTQFIDHYHEARVPGIGMSGGYGLFEKGGRLPAHFHDFDESICIIDGTAICVVEGRRHTLSGNATALQPRGRVHYFVNECATPMAMLWVYAGPSPDRIVVDECCATAEGNPWKDSPPS